MIKILHIVANDKLSGAEKVVLDICRNMKKGYECIAVTSGDNLGQYFKEAGIKYYASDISRLNPANIYKIKNIIKEENIDIVHGHDVKASIAGYIAAKSGKKPVISHIHATYPWIKKPNLLKFIDSFFRNKYEKSIACSETAKDYYLEHNLKADKSSFLTLVNSLDFTDFDEEELKSNRTHLKRELNLGSEEIIYGYAGRLIPLKGVDMLINAFYEISKEIEGVKLLIIGDGEEEERLKNLTNQLNLRDKVIFAGYQKDIYTYINLMDIFILPSVREGLPMVVLEAAALKKAVITTPLPGVMEFIKNGETGLVLKKRSCDDMAMTMKYLYNDRQMMKKLGENAYGILKDQYSIDSYIDELTKIYSSVLNSRMRSSR